MLLKITYKGASSLVIGNLICAEINSKEAINKLLLLYH